ncbi:MAG: EAL domain-containing protein [Planctomycetes bacterium]|nr:EAL domain-containing protein [Planctomycetota bacterium]
MAPETIAHDSRAIAAELIERSSAIAMRSVGTVDNRDVIFIAGNVAALGYDREDFLSGRIHWNDCIHPEDKEDLVNLLASFVEMGNDEYSVVYRIRRRDGTTVWINDSTVVVRDDSGAIRHFDSTLMDYTETKEHIERIGDNYRQQNVFKSILQGIHDVDHGRALQVILDSVGTNLDISQGVLYQDPASGGGVIRHWHSPELGRHREAAPTALDFSRTPEVTAQLRAHGQCIVHFGEVPERSAEAFARAGIVAAAMYAITVHGEPYGILSFEESGKKRIWSREIVGFLDTIAQLVPPVVVRQRNEQAIQSMLLTDQLTGLNNRRQLETCLNQAIEAARHSGETGYILFLDMDDFKIINDAYGHDYGDAILQEISGFLSFLCGADSIFHFGGDEFVILLQANAAHDVYDVINSLHLRAQLPWSVRGHTFYCTLSIGVVAFPEGIEDSRQIMKYADIAMYQAKKMGKNNFAFYTSTFDNESEARAEIERAMRESIENHFAGFEVFYQPLMDLDGRILGAEALMRWTLPSGRRMSPAQFIPLAEYLGLIIPLGEFIMETAARCCHRINRIRPDFFISVNVSIRQFKQQEFIENILLLLADTHVDHANILLEITEGMAIHDMQRMRVIADELRASGLRIAMDDFGTGYSSLSSMRQLPFDVVKIDRAFINDVVKGAGDEYSRSFIRFITKLVHSMNRKVCVEGVETQEQLDYCRQCGVDYVQGYHCWKPMPDDELVAVVERETPPAARSGPTAIAPPAE